MALDSGEAFWGVILQAVKFVNRLNQFSLRSGTLTRPGYLKVTPMLTSENFSGAQIKRELAAEALRDARERDERIGEKAVEAYLAKLPIADPSDYSILDRYFNQGVVALKVHYPKCETYGGVKILILEGVTQLELMNLKELDPHFLGHKTSPCVRVAADDKGWQRAKKIVDLLVAEQ